LSLPLPGWSLSWPPGLSRPPSPSLWALPSRLSGRSGDSARCSPEDSLPSVRFPESAARDAGGWLLGGLTTSTAPRARPGAATAVLVWASSTTRPRAAPMRAPSSAPTTTRNWPRRRNDWSTGPPRSNTLTTLPKPHQPKLEKLDLGLSADRSPSPRPLSRGFDGVQVAKVRDERTSLDPRQRRGTGYDEGRSPTSRGRSSLHALRPEGVMPVEPP
jgi:hypothetical protein